MVHAHRQDVFKPDADVEDSGFQWRPVQRNLSAGDAALKAADAPGPVQRLQLAAKGRVHAAIRQAQLILGMGDGRLGHQGRRQACHKAAQDEGEKPAPHQISSGRGRGASMMMGP